MKLVEKNLVPKQIYGKMLKTTDCYKKLCKSVILEELREWCDEQESWSQLSGSSFMHKPAPSFMLKDPFIADLVERGWKEAIIMKSYPHSHYHFHIDLNNRPAAINLLLGKNENCHTVFIGEQYYRNQSRAIELKYEYGHFYLVNTHQKHGVFNFGTDRYLFTLSAPLQYGPAWHDCPRDKITPSDAYYKLYKEL